MSGKEWTLVELLNTTRQYLSEKNIENPRRNVEALLGSVLNLPKIQLYLQHDRPISESELDRFRSLIKRRVKHEPLQLIIGEVDFCGTKIRIIPGTLIPRPETEELALKVLDQISTLPEERVLSILDIGCGTGCLGISIAAQKKNTVIDAVDIDPTAVLCTKSNVEKNELTSRVKVIQADLFSPSFVSQTHPPYDIVISNPPYVSETDFQLLDPEIREYEPRQALIASNNGLAYYKQICRLLPDLLKNGGLLALEMGIHQVSHILEMFQNSEMELSVYNDLGGIPRILIGNQHH